MTAVLEQEQVQKESKIMTAKEYRQTEEYKLSVMTDRQIVNACRRGMQGSPLQICNNRGGIEALVHRVLERDSFGSDPYCLRGPKRSKIGRPQ